MSRGTSSAGVRPQARVVPLLTSHQEEAFWSRVARGGPEECWPWRAFANPNGYGVFKIGELGFLAHRVAYSLVVGEIPPGAPHDYCVCHSCDVSLCCNPAHLFLGSQADNVADMVAKRRDRHPAGADHPRATLTADDVEQIRSRSTGAWGEQVALAREFGVERSAISKIVRGRTWRGP